MPRRRSSAQRSGSIPVSARTSVDLPWSTCPAVATTYISRPSAPRAGGCGCGRRRASRGHSCGPPRAGRPRRGGRRRPGSTERRSSSSMPFSIRPATAGHSPRRTAAPQRSGSARSSGSATAALGRVTPGAPPPPTAASVATTLAGTACAARVATIRSARSKSSAGPAVSERATGGGGPLIVASRAARVSLSTRSARASGWRSRRRTRGSSPSSIPACGPPSSLSPLAVTRFAPSAREVAASGSPGSSGCGASRPEPMSWTSVTSRAASSATVACLVNPSTR